MSDCRVARHRQVHPPQVRGDSRPRPPRRKQRNRRISNGGHVDGGGGPAVLPGHLARGVRVHHHSLHHSWRWRGAEPDRRRREPLERLRGVLGIYEARLEKSRYLAGDSISFADLNHIPFTFYFMTTPYAKVFDDYPKVKAWWEMLMARPAVQRVCKHAYGV
uniref:glutathione transferase n=1 Tax=Aegilops tauschii subsp. strangulata TaxID=200361 RepID=A0A453EC01_AEGTS